MINNTSAGTHRKNFESFINNAFKLAESGKGLLLAKEFENFKVLPEEKRESLRTSLWQLFFEQKISKFVNYINLQINEDDFKNRLEDLKYELKILRNVGLIGDPDLKNALESFNNIFEIFKEIMLKNKTSRR